MSFPSRERGLKPTITCATAAIRWSFPSRERGLKLFDFDPPDAPLMSFPSRERGLKLKNPIVKPPLFFVVPLAGTWIETCHIWRLCTAGYCRSPRGNVD